MRSDSRFDGPIGDESARICICIFLVHIQTKLQQGYKIVQNLDCAESLPEVGKSFRVQVDEFSKLKSFASKK